MAAQISMSGSIAGLSIQGAVNVTGNGGIGNTFTNIPVAQAGSLTTRTGDTGGTITIPLISGITTSNKVDLYWDGGFQYNCTVSDVTGDVITVASGTGTALPSTHTAIQVSPVTPVRVMFSGSYLQELLAQSNTRSAITFLDKDGVPVATPCGLAGSNYTFLWTAGGGLANPYTGLAIVSAQISNGDLTKAANINLGLAYLNGTE